MHLTRLAALFAAVSILSPAIAKDGSKSRSSAPAPYCAPSKASAPTPSPSPAPAASPTPAPTPAAATSASPAPSRSSSPAPTGSTWRPAGDCRSTGHPLTWCPEERRDFLPPPVIAEVPAEPDPIVEIPESTISGTATIAYIPLIVEVPVPVQSTANVCPVEAKPKPRLGGAKPRTTLKPEVCK